MLHTISIVIRLTLLLLAGLWTCCIIAAEPTAPAPPGFDPTRHMLVSEVKPGMKGYGLSVFTGTRIDRFDVEVISVLHNFTPKQDVVLIRAAGANLEHTGAIAGMSGSPIYLNDDQGRSRLIGAFAYGWPMVKDPVAGVQPIQYMLDMPIQDAAKAQASADLSASGGRWSALSAITSARRQMRHLLEPDPAAPGNASAQMASLMIPMSITGLSETQIRPLSRLLAPMHIMPLQAGGGGGGGGGNDAPGKLEPGSVMAVPLLSGDIDMTAVGTCTEVLGERVYGFGHPFTGEGAVAMPLCSGQINGVIANLATSFKLGASSGNLGTLLTDQTSGVAGRVGDPPPTAPITLRIRYADGSLDQTYHFQAVIHPQFTPLLASMAVTGSVSAARQLPHLNTLSYKVRVAFADGRELKLANLVANADAMSFLTEIAAPLTAVSDNPYSRVLARSIDGEIEVSNSVRAAEIVSAGVPHQAYRQGETIRLNARIRPFRGIETTQELELPIPEDLADGLYQLVVSDVSRYVSDERTGEAYRFSASNLDEVFTATNELSALRGDAIYLRLIASGPQQGVAVGRTALPKLPPSQRRLLTSSGRAQITPYTPSLTRTVPVQWVMTGATDLPIQISRDLRPVAKMPFPPVAPPPPTSAPALHMP